MLTERQTVRGRPPGATSSQPTRDLQTAALLMSGGAYTSSPANLDRHYARKRALLRLQGFDPALGWYLKIEPQSDSQ